MSRSTWNYTGASSRIDAFIFISYNADHHDKVSIELSWQEWIPLHLTDPGPIRIPGIQERAECLISRFKGKPDRPPKVITMHGHLVVFRCFVIRFSLVHFVYAYIMHIPRSLISSFNISSLLHGAQEKAVPVLFRAVESFPRPD